MTDSVIVNPGHPVATVRSLRSVSLLVPDPRAAIDFYTGSWGLSAVDQGDDAAWLRGTGEEHHILKLQAAEQNALGGVTFAVGTTREIDDAARALTTLGIPLLREPGVHDEAAGGYSLALVDPEGRTRAYFPHDLTGDEMAAALRGQIAKAGGAP